MSDCTLLVVAGWAQPPAFSRQATRQETKEWGLPKREGGGGRHLYTTPTSKLVELAAAVGKSEEAWLSRRGRHASKRGHCTQMPLPKATHVHVRVIQIRLHQNFNKKKLTPQKKVLPSDATPHSNSCPIFKKSQESFTPCHPT